MTEDFKQTTKGTNNSKNFTNTTVQEIVKSNKTHGLIKHGTKVVSVVWNDCQIVKSTEK